MHTHTKLEGKYKEESKREREEIVESCGENYVECGTTNCK